MSALDIRIPTLIIGVLISALGAFLISFHRYAFFPERPSVNIKISRQESNYKEGLQINGVKWSKGYQSYLIGVINSSGTSEISDIRFTVHLPGAILSRRVEVMDAINPKIYSFVPPMQIADQTGQIQDVQTALSNNITISGDKLRPQGQIFVMTVIDPKKDLIDKSFVDLGYSFIGFLERKENVRPIYPIIRHGEELVVDTARTLPVNFPRHYAYYGQDVNWGFDFEEK
jgi:hypothetical protein